MIYGHIDYPSAFANLNNYNPWGEALAWLRDLTENTPLGITERYGGKMSLNVQK